MKYQIMLTNKKLDVTCGFNKWDTLEEALNEAIQSNKHLWKFHQDQAEYTHYWVKEIR